MRRDDRDDDAPWEEEDAPWEEEDDEEEETAVLPCPSCGVEVYEDAERCPSCGEYIVRRLRAWEGRPWWWAALGLAGIGALILWLL